jgi:hypothetical protein
MGRDDEDRSAKTTPLVADLGREGKVLVSQMLSVIICADCSVLWDLDREAKGDSLCWSGAFHGQIGG